MDTAKLTEMRARYDALWRERDLLEARLYEVAAEIDDFMGDEHGAAWNRARAVASRSGTAEDYAMAHRLWVVSMAHMHLRNGTVPGGDSATEITDEIERIRAVQTTAL